MMNLRATVLLLALVGLGCDEGRFPTCNDNGECAGKTDGGAPICFLHRCVECQYDGDCAPGKICNNTKHTCESIDERAGEKGEDAGAPGANWEPPPPDDCVKKCKDEACKKKCTDKPKGTKKP